MKKLLALAALSSSLAAACNEPFSNEDLLFLKAIPRAEDVTIAVPQNSGSGLHVAQNEPQTPAGFYVEALKVATALNGAVDFVLKILDFVTSIPPTVREPNKRVWGPFAETKDGLTIERMLTIERVITSTIVKTTETSTPTAVEEIFTYKLEERLAGDPEYIPLIAGAFAPSEDIEKGMGWIFLNFEAHHAKIDPRSNERGLLLIGYDNRFGQQTIQVAINIPEVQPDTQPEFLFIRARWLADNRGRADVAAGGGDLGAAVYFISECWSADFSRVFLFSNLPEIMPFGRLDNCAEELRTDPED
jgi:hypothetical protein